MAQFDDLDRRLKVAESKLYTLERIEQKIDEILKFDAQLKQILYPDMTKDNKPGLVNQVRELLIWREKVSKTTLYVVSAIGTPILGIFGVLIYKLLVNFDSIMKFVKIIEAQNP